ncbi:protein ALP1-like [Photinus pyralis]|uniref:protein ALP1-like n=1 Tax=Photinus pyralis TaxID=7054 RepID=UPI0012677B20|nr:protein ALP1-like [Photinus pyralis]
MDSTRKKKIIVASAAFLFLKLNEKKRRRRRRWWMTSIFRDRENRNASELLLTLTQEDSGHFTNFSRMTATDFEELLQLIGPKIVKKDTYYREAIPAKERLSVTLRFLATGDSYASLSYLFKFSKQVIATIIPEVCAAIIDALRHEIKTPTSREEWLKISEDYYNLWNFPHCLGAIDGKHIALQAPINSGSDYLNYKSHFSIVLMAVVDANYKFIYADVGCQGRISDGGVFKNTSFYLDMESNSLNLPEEAPLPTTNSVAPYVFVADDAFPLMKNIMKPYTGSWEKGTKERAFNYRLSRARRIVENAFGILSSVFRVFRKPMLLNPDKATLVVLACLYLHNFLRNRKNYNNFTEKSGVEKKSTQGNDYQERSAFSSFRCIPRKTAENVKKIRDTFAEFCKTERVSWQDDYE